MSHARIIIFCLAALLLPPVARAAQVTATLDRDNVQLGDTVTLNIRVEGATSSVAILSSAPMIASCEPCTSALMTSGNSLRPEVLACAIICSSEPRMPVARAACFSRFWRTR